MPKLIANLRENILACARRQLLEQGYDSLTIRGVAGECGIASGTVYNYFPSKEMLAASVMMEDWIAVISRMKNECCAAESMREALLAMHRGIEEFYGIYRAVWAGYVFSGSAKSAYGRRRIMLVRQLADCLAPAMERFIPGAAAGTGVFFAENILLCSGDSPMTFEEFFDIVRGIIE